MGDLNLSHRVSKDRLKLEKICGHSKKSILNEITRTVSNNQLDYVLVQSGLKEHCFASSFYNFVSDHRSITLRIGLNGNQLSKQTCEKITFAKKYYHF